jgi:hypothetical protein
LITTFVRKGLGVVCAAETASYWQPILTQYGRLMLPSFARSGLTRPPNPKDIGPVRQTWLWKWFPPTISILRVDAKVTDWLDAGTRMVVVV